MGYLAHTSCALFCFCHSEENFCKVDSFGRGYSVFMGNLGFKSMQPPFAREEEELIVFRSQPNSIASN